MIPALALLVGASALALAAHPIPGCPPAVRRAAWCVILAGSCVGWAAPLPNPWWLGALGGLVGGVVAGRRWRAGPVAGPALAAFGFLAIGWSVVGAAWTGAALMARRPSRGA